MAQTSFGRTNFVIQAAGTEVTWRVTWGLEDSDWFNFELSPGVSGDENDFQVASTLEVTRHWVTRDGIPPFLAVSSWYVVKNESPPGSELAFGFNGLKSRG